MCKVFLEWLSFMFNNTASTTTVIETLGPDEPDLPIENVPEETEPDNNVTEPEIIMVENFHWNGKVVLLDCGHAKETPGKRSPKRTDGTRFYEYESNRQIGRIIANKLEKLGIKYHFVEDLDDTADKGLSARAATANQYCSKYGAGNCIFISLHSNACGSGDEWKDSARGWSIYTTKGTTKSDACATIFFNEAQAILPNYGMTLRKDMSDGDPDYEENFTVIYKTNCPSVLIEAMFYTSHQDLAFLDSDEGREALSQIVVNGIKKICSC